MNAQDQRDLDNYMRILDSNVSDPFCNPDEEERVKDEAADALSAMLS